MDTVLKVCFIFTILCFLNLTHATGQSTGLMQHISSKIEHLIRQFPQEKIYLRMDKPLYTSGDTLWFSITAIDASYHEKPGVSEMVYVQLTRPDSIVVYKKSIRITERWGYGDIPIDPLWPEGTYTLQVYSNYMLNYDTDYIFTRDVVIKNAASAEKNVAESPEKKERKLNITFYPEGGDLVDQLECVVAFEAFYSDGMPAEGPLVVQDRQGNEITHSATLHEGKGFFTIKPRSDNRYQAVMLDNTFVLPTVRTTGYVIKINNRNKEHIQVVLQTNIEGGLVGTFLLGHIRGQVFLTKDGLAGNTQSLKIDKKGLPSGVAQFTLFTKDGVPVCERTVFIDYRSELPKADISTAYAFERLRSKTKVTVDLKDLVTLKGLKGDFSVSVWDHTLLPASEMDVDILSYFLLTSDLTKHVRRPGFYFLDDSPKRNVLLDLVMMTHGWTRIKSPILIYDDEPVLSHAPETGSVVRGTVLQHGRPAEGALVELLVLEGDYLSGETTTDAFGRFVFDELPVYGSQMISLTASALGQGGKSDRIIDGISILIEQPGNTLIYTNNHYVHYPAGDDERFQAYLQKSAERHKYDSLYSAMSVDLDEVTVKAKKKSKADALRKERGILYTNVDKRLELDSLPYINPNWTIYDLVQARSPGVQVIGSRATVQKFRMRGNNSIQLASTAQVFVEGSPVTDEYAGSINIYDVAFVDIVRGLSATSVFGAQGANGIVAVYLRKERRDASGTLAGGHQVRINMDGYYQAREFYQPDYAVTFAGSEKPDLRSTLYWSPRIKTDMDGQTSFSFYTGDVPSSYMIEIQGITSDGRPFVSRKIIDVRD